MSPLSTAIETRLAWVTHDETHVYKTFCEENWSISVPHGKRRALNASIRPVDD